MLNVEKNIRYVGSYDTIIKNLKASDRNMLQYKYIYIEYRLYNDKPIKDIMNEYKLIINFLRKYDVKDDNINFVIKKYYDDE